MMQVCFDLGFSNFALRWDIRARKSDLRYPMPISYPKGYPSIRLSISILHVRIRSLLEAPSSNDIPDIKYQPLFNVTSQNLYRYKYCEPIHACSLSLIDRLIVSRKILAYEICVIVCIQCLAIRGSYNFLKQYTTELLTFKSEVQEFLGCI